MPLCDFNNRRMTCPACGYRARRLPTFRYCRPVAAKEWRPVAVGDAVEKALSTLGISKERVQRLTRAVGVEGCGCPARQRWLNEAGNKVQIRARELLRKIGRFYVQP